MMMSTILQNTGGRGEGQGAGHAQRDTLTFDHDLDFDTRAADAFPGLYTSATLPALTMPPAFTSTRRTEGLWPSWLTMSAPQSTVQATAKLSEWEGTYWCKCWSRHCHLTWPWINPHPLRRYMLLELHYTTPAAPGDPIEAMSNLHETMVLGPEAGHM